MLRKICLLLFSFVFLVVLVSVCLPNAYANHSWGGYHWARTQNPLSLKLGDNLTSNWTPFLNTASSDWSVSDVLDTLVVAGSTNPKNCRATLGRVEVCNSKYGNTGWLGIAQIWVSGLHITQGVTKLNDTYFNTKKYNTPVWRQFVVCQEVGHTFGLDHQDEVFDNPNLGTCMDYTNDPSTNQHPNQHDYDELDLIYAHLDDFTSSSQTKLNAGQIIDNLDNPSDWGKIVKQGQKTAIFERDFGASKKVFTFVIYAD